MIHSFSKIKTLIICTLLYRNTLAMANEIGTENKRYGPPKIPILLWYAY